MALDLKDKYAFIVQVKDVYIDEELDIVFGRVWDGRVEVKFKIETKQYRKVINGEDDIDDFSVIEINKFKITDLHADLEETSLKIKKFSHLGKVGKKIMIICHIQPS